ncbi:flagellar filament capping protein FliD [Texcoconibacillus texcoconensis]|nr:flagellar filament capping protein FliD [Texcoconibacillus texcoconensis]
MTDIINNSNRMMGMASGMDVDNQVRELMQLEREPLDRMESDRNELELKVDEYREMNMKFQSFDDKLFNDLTMRGNMMQKDVTSSDESRVSARASADVGDFNIRIDEVEQLATPETVVGGEIDDFEDLDPDAPLEEQMDLLGLDDVDLEGNKIITYDGDGNQQGDDDEIEIDTDDSLNDIIDDINSSDAGVTMFYDEFAGKVSVTRDETGVYNPDTELDSEDGEGYEREIKFEGDFLTKGLKLPDDSEEGDYSDKDIDDIEGASLTKAQNAEFTVNGMTTERQSNSFDYNGVEITLHDQFDAEDGSVNLNVETDADHMVDEILEFVDTYNELIIDVDEKISEEYDREYQVLTDRQMQEMEEREVEMWQERSRSGLLRNDQILRSGLDGLRNVAYDQVHTGSDEITHLTDVGIETSDDYLQRGQLVVDEDELRSAVEDDPEAVYQLFASDGSDDGEESDRPSWSTGTGEGIARQMRDQISQTTDSLTERAGNEFSATNDNFTLGREINQAEDQMANFERRLQQTEDRYWDQFRRMEQAMAEAQQQSQQMMSQMGGMM